MKVWRGTDGDSKPVEMECDVFGHPNRTSTNETMYDNTHFKTEEEAWESIRSSCDAGMRLLARDIESCETRLVSLQEQAAEQVKRYAGIPKPNATHDGRRIRRTVDGIVGNLNGGE